MTIYRGHLFHVAGSPSLERASDALVSEPDGALAVDAAGRISYAGSWAGLPASLSDDSVVITGAFLLPGFVDTHVHFPQTLTTDEFGGGELLEWLERCVFPAESRLADPVFADLVASEFVRRRISAGTTPHSSSAPPFRRRRTRSSPAPSTRACAWSAAAASRPSDRPAPPRF